MKEPKLGLLKESDIALSTDLYQLTMMACYLHNKNDLSTFEMFIRKLPKNRNYLVTAGLEQVLAYLQKARFSDEDIAYLRKEKIFDERFLDYLSEWRFSGDVWAMPEGTLAFGNEPILRITAKRCEAQLVESYLLSMINYQTTVASKAARIVEAAKGRPVIDFALRRCHGPGAAFVESRASYIGGCVGTSNVIAGKEFGIPVKGTMAHALVMTYADEISAFREFCNTFKNTELPLVLLIDTYDTIEGAKNVIKVAKLLEAEGKRLAGVRLDSGNLTELSKRVRQMFDEAGLGYVTIFGSNDLNEYKIKRMLDEGAMIFAFGVGTEMGVSLDAPALGGVYKLIEDTEDGNIVPKIKLSDGKITYPGKKQVYRITEGGKFVKDIIALDGEACAGEPLLVKVMEKGNIVYDIPDLKDIRQRALSQINMLPHEIKDIEKTSEYKVEISSGLQELTNKLIEKYRRKNDGKIV